MAPHYWRPLGWDLETTTDLLPMSFIIVIYSKISKNYFDTTPLDVRVGAIK
jgi:hypothetical protein